MAEQWRPVVHWEGLYSVSSLGRVRSEDRITTSNGRARRVRGCILLANPTGGHPAVALCRDGRSHTYTVSRLVLEAFVGPCPGGKVARHFPDTDPHNNRLDNLIYGPRGKGDPTLPDLQRRPEGHPFNLVNTRLRPDGRKYCVLCERRRERERRERALRVRKGRAVSA